MLFKRRDLEQYTDSLADYMPGGVLFAAKSIQDTNFRRLLRGLAGELFTSNGYLKSYSEEILPDQTVLFISEWERALGIPDGCFKGDQILVKRRRDILVKLAASGVQTAADFESVALLFGYLAVVVPGIEAGESRFTIIIRFNLLPSNRFPLEYPIPFGDDDLSILECVFQKLKPANCNLIFEQV